MAQGQRCGVQVAQAPHPRLAASLLGIGEDLRHHDVEQVQHVVLRRGLQRTDEGDQGRQAPVVRQAGDRRRLGRSGEPRQGQHARARQPIRAGQPGRQQP